MLKPFKTLFYPFKHAFVNPCTNSLKAFKNEERLTSEDEAGARARARGAQHRAFVHAVPKQKGEEATVHPFKGL